MHDTELELILLAQSYLLISEITSSNTSSVISQAFLISSISSLDFIALSFHNSFVIKLISKPSFLVKDTLVYS